MTSIAGRAEDTARHGLTSPGVFRAPETRLSPPPAPLGGESRDSGSAKCGQRASAAPPPRPQALPPLPRKRQEEEREKTARERARQAATATKEEDYALQLQRELRIGGL